MSAQNNNNTTDVAAPADTKVPSWVTAELFEELMKEIVPTFKKIINFNAFPALAAGENYATLMLRVEIVVKLENGEDLQKSFMLKVQPESQIMGELTSQHNLFDIERDMYAEIVPDFEKFYRDAGVEVTFGAKYYKLNTDKDHILLADLRPRDFKNMNRLEGLDMEHAKCVLRKLAQWHAASALRYEIKGEYKRKLAQGFFSEDQRELLDQMSKAMIEPFVTNLKTYKGHEINLDNVSVENFNSMDEFFQMLRLDPQDFHVLNHGDCWANNIMFQHDAAGKIKETYLVDYQMPHYGSPAQDLYYFLISSTQFEIKLKQFDYFIRYYHEHLIANLTLLKYTKKMPTLRDLHRMLIKDGLWGLSTASGTMAIVLLDPNENASFDNLLGGSEAGMDFKTLMYTNKRYRQHIEMLLPWLHNRGAIGVWRQL